MWILGLKGLKGVPPWKESNSHNYCIFQSLPRAGVSDPWN